MERNKAHGIKPHERTHETVKRLVDAQFFRDPMDAVPQGVSA